jgi:hypothetical protein
MKTFIQKFAVAFVVASAIPTAAFAAAGSVSLVFSPLSSNVTSPGSSITLSLSLNVSGFSGSDAVGGVDFLLTSLDSSSGFFIKSRTIDLSGSFPDPITDDQIVAIRPGASLDPTNNSDLGQAVDVFPSGAVQDGTYHLANYVIGVDVGVAPGDYDFDTMVNLWSDQNGDDHEMNAPGTFSLTVIPEPGTSSLLVLSALATFGLKLVRNRRRTN